MTYTAPNAAWRTSSYSAGNGGQCLAVRDDIPRVVPVRDTKLTNGPVLRLPVGSWTALLNSVR